MVCDGMEKQQEPKMQENLRETQLKKPGVQQVKREENIDSGKHTIIWCLWQARIKCEPHCQQLQ